MSDTHEELREALRHCPICEGAGWYEGIGPDSATGEPVQIQEQCELCARVESLFDQLQAQIAEWEASFKLYDDASRRAIAMWQEAHPDKSDTWPAQANLIVWLMGERDQLQLAEERARAGWKAELKRANQLQEKVDAAQELCRIYFEIAERTVGEEQVRKERDAAIREAREARGDSGARSPEA
jgi:hypothetical protein